MELNESIDPPEVNSKEGDSIEHIKQVHTNTSKEIQIATQGETYNTNPKEDNDQEPLSPLGREKIRSRKTGKRQRNNASPSQIRKQNKDTTPYNSHE